jgi:predicted enzyme related to lactoylglutathione lyase
MEMMLNIDVPDMAQAESFYCMAFGLAPGRRFGGDMLELRGSSLLIYLLKKAPGTQPIPGGIQPRHYERHWCPVHFDIVVPDIVAAAAQVLAAGAVQEKPIKHANWGKLGLFADPFGHGFCLVEFVGRGYDEIAD